MQALKSNNFMNASNNGGAGGPPLEVNRGSSTSGSASFIRSSYASVSYNRNSYQSMLAIKEDLSEIH